MHLDVVECRSFWQHDIVAGRWEIMHPSGARRVTQGDVSNLLSYCAARSIAHHCVTPSNLCQAKQSIQ